MDKNLAKIIKNQRFIQLDTTHTECSTDCSYCITYINPSGEKSLQCVQQDRGAKIFLAIFITLFLLIILLLVVILCIKRRKKVFGIKNPVGEAAATNPNDIENPKFPKSLSTKREFNFKSTNTTIVNSNENKINKEEKSLNFNLNLNSASAIKHQNSHLNTNYNTSNLESRISSEHSESKNKKKKKYKNLNEKNKSRRNINNFEESPKTNKNASSVSNRSNIDENNSNRVLNNSKNLNETEMENIDKKVSNALGEQMNLKRKIKFFSKENTNDQRKSVNLDADNIQISRKGSENSYLHTKDNLLIENKIDSKLNDLNLNLKKHKVKNKHFHNDKEEMRIPKRLTIPKYEKIEKHPET